MVGECDPVFLTGGTGFIGSHVLRAFLDAGFPVRALVRGKPGRLASLDGCTPVTGDLDAPGSLTRAMDGCRYLVHVAGFYSFAPSDRGHVWTTNVAGTRGLLTAAHLAGIERAIVTSSSAAVGPAIDGQPATEDNHVHTHERLSAYHGSKVAEEWEALVARLPVTMVLPTGPIGPGDWKPTQTGRMILDFMRGGIFASVAGGMNLVAVEDVARAHVLALERGRTGERYLAGGENLSFQEIWGLLAERTGRPAPRLQIPHGVALTFAWGDELRCRMRGGQPRIPLEGARMSRHHMYVDYDKAKRELGYEASPVGNALTRAVAWYRDHGYAG